MSMERKLVMGNEAIALGAVRAGVRMVAGYPGTPSTEILETVAKHNDGSIHVEWSTNEKAAMEVGAGAAYAGARTLVTMKQVGLNVASDPLMSLAYVGVKGGMVIVSADDPGPISSQTEQDLSLIHISKASTTRTTPLTILRTRSTSPPKSACPGVSMILILVPL